MASPEQRNPQSQSVRDGGPAEAGDFVADALASLISIARRHRLQTLGFLLEMAQMEADEIARNGGRSRQ